MPAIISADDILSVAANSDSGELVPSDRISLPDSGVLYLYAVGSATGLNTQLKVNGNDWTYDEELHKEQDASTLHRESDLVIMGKVKKGDTVSLKFRNSTAGALNVNYQLVVM
jgi:hypothetical protein